MQTFDNSEERVTEQEQRLLFKRWEDAERREAAAQSLPAVADIAEATGMTAQAVRDQLRSVRAEQSRAAETVRLRRERVWQTSWRGLPLLAALGLAWALFTHPPSFHHTRGETPVAAAAEHARRGDAEYKAGHFDDAEEEYLLAVQQEPGDATYRDDLGNALYSQKKYAEAVPQYQEAVRLTPGHVHYVQNLADTLMEVKRYQEAAASYKSALALGPGSASAYKGLGASLAGLGRNAEAETAFRASLRLAPGDADTLDGLGAAVGDQHRIAEAAGYFRQAAALDPSSGQYRRNLDTAEKMLRAGEK